MVDSSYDVAIVGAGPAGSTATRELSKMGYSTVLLDRRKEIGIPVQCGELLPTPNEIQNLF
ncbi:MAG: digeranylgeranylglycerophospholipid reductase, partial [Candidatus Thorarchaeota archaeon]|nr:digeranylgeranylglycerophospholipid reductase [Candidatus Thorarchaeota archaeon]